MNNMGVMEKQIFDDIKSGKKTIEELVKTSLTYEKGHSLLLDNQEHFKNNNNNQEKIVYYGNNEQKVRKEILQISQGDVFYVDFLSNPGSVISGCRPAIVVGNRLSNENSTIIQVVPMTTKPMKQPTHTSLIPSDFFSDEEIYGCALGEQRCSVSISQLIKKMGKLKPKSRMRVLASDVCSINPSYRNKKDFLFELLDKNIFSLDVLKNVLDEREIKAETIPEDNVRELDSVKEIRYIKLNHMSKKSVEKESYIKEKSYKRPETKAKKPKVFKNKHKNSLKK